MRLPAPPNIARGLTGLRDVVQPRGSNVSSSSEPAATTTPTTVAALAAQWGNPTDISTILMVIGGDVVQKALAQGAGLWYFTPVCFSFGWVSYAFIALVNVTGDGRLLPPPDYPAKVLNLRSGYVRENRSWVVGRLLRDLETRVARGDRRDGDACALRITVYDALENRSGGLTRFSWTGNHLVALVIIVAQFGLAVGPIVLYGEWDIMMIIAVGTVLAQMAGSLPQWRAEKLPNRQNRKEVYALTQGNGSREVVVIRGNGQCLDLEELAALTNPRGGKLWEKFTGDNLLTAPQVKGVKGLATSPRAEYELRKSRKSYGLPLGFWLTRIMVTVQSILWLLLLVNVSTPRESNWFLLGIGAIGMFQNGISAGSERDPKHRNLPVHKVDTIRSQKVMDGIMDFEVTYGLGKPLLHEFFPGDLQDDEKEWWAGNQEPYDNKRQKDERSRGVPRTRLRQQEPRNSHSSEPEPDQAALQSPLMETPISHSHQDTS
ncbi:hypothetical protein PG985_014672 [Apiospora marii]|uniref:Uncharacterized protein n=1 Tax=Apiospora marii TaxID=335849 RepID=A0ABR1R4B3_9PEZI